MNDLLGAKSIHQLLLEVKVGYNIDKNCTSTLTNEEAGSILTKTPKTLIWEKWSFKVIPISHNN